MSDAVNARERHCMPLTASRSFKAVPRPLVRAQGTRRADRRGGKIIEGGYGLFRIAAGSAPKEVTS